LNVRNNWAFIATDTRTDSRLYGCILGVWANPINDRPLIRNRATEIVLLAIAIAVTFSTLMYHLIEKPLARNRAAPNK
jgi:peptidoglycan/LPS O-acetylase OafA/YrhL